MPGERISQRIAQPDEVRRRFNDLFVQDPEMAVAYLHDLGVAGGYLNPSADARNICWTAPSDYGTLECTINLAKPEKDPRDIAQASTQDSARTCAERADASESAPQLPCASSVIPQCDLCWENEGYPGCASHPAKPGLRIAAITLGGETWGLQYSPYAYFQEHCIVISQEHRPMKVDDACFARLLDFVDKFPFYFIGSNAGLPIVGGSILSHDHYQGGRHTFALMRAPVERNFTLPETPSVRCGIVRWPASTIRLQSADRAALLAAASKILATWNDYSNQRCGILAHSTNAAGERVAHNALNPIARRTSSGYIFDLVLRNNRTDSEHPWGIFHPAEQLHHIKRENIGLIEIMGLAILPPRLARELPAVESVLLDSAQRGIPAHAVAQRLRENAETRAHAPWAAEIYSRRVPDILATGCGGVGARKDKGGGMSSYMEEEVARVFAGVLHATGVFKRDSAGRAGWDDFLGNVSKGRVH